MAELEIPEHHRRELVLAIDGLIACAEEARQNVLDGESALALIPLDVMRKGLLPIRNGIGQWINRIECPKCGVEGPNIVSIHQEDAGPNLHMVGVGFRCQFCRNEWGFGP